MDHNTDEFNAAVQAKVEEILSSREEEEARQAAEEALREAKETFETLKASLEAKDAKIREYEEAFAALDSDNPSEAEVAANEKIVELEKERDEWKKKAMTATTALDVIAREETAANRMAELGEAGVVLDDEAAEAQYVKVRDMDDEAFAAYMSELVALKSKYYSPSADEETETPDPLELSDEKIKEISGKLGCDPADSECISLIKEVAEMVTAVTGKREEEEVASDDSPNTDADEDIEGEGKEVASEKLSLSEALSQAMDQEIKPHLSMKEECAQAWEAVYAERRGQKSE